MKTKLINNLKKELCKKHGLSFSTKELAQKLIDNLRVPAKRKIKQCYGCKKYYIETKFYKKIY